MARGKRESEQIFEGVYKNEISVWPRIIVVSPSLGFQCGKNEY
jgi:hypothetical protein